jgi:hypothetical protein
MGFSTQFKKLRKIFVEPRMNFGQDSTTWSRRFPLPAPLLKSYFTRRIMTVRELESLVFEWPDEGARPSSFGFD